MFKPNHTFTEATTHINVQACVTPQVIHALGGILTFSGRDFRGVTKINNKRQVNIQYSLAHKLKI